MFPFSHPTLGLPFPVSAFLVSDGVEVLVKIPEGQGLGLFSWVTKFIFFCCDLFQIRANLSWVLYCDIKDKDRTEESRKLLSKNQLNLSAGFSKLMAAINF